NPYIEPSDPYIQQYTPQPEYETETSYQNTQSYYSEVYQPEIIPSTMVTTRTNSAVFLNSICMILCTILHLISIILTLIFIEEEAIVTVTEALYSVIIVILCALGACFGATSSFGYLNEREKRLKRARWVMIFK